MNPPELVLHHQRLDLRAAHLSSESGRLETRLATSPLADRLEAELEVVGTGQRELDLRLRDREREVGGHRDRVRQREKDLMSGRIRNPSELIKLGQEIAHMKAALSVEEDGELSLMETMEGLEAESGRLSRELEVARAQSAAEAPDLTSRLEAGRQELAAVESERTATWEAIPEEWREAYRRIRARHSNPVAEAIGNQCQACHVTLTSNGMQVLRRSGLLLCDNCGRILVVA